MNLTIKYVQDGEMNTETLDYFLEHVIIPIANSLDVSYTFEELDEYSLVHFEDVDLIDYTKAYLALDAWDDITVGVFQKDLLQSFGVKEEEAEKEICLAYWVFFNAIGAETYTWGD